MKQNPTVHIAITIDASTSMRQHEATVVEVVEGLIQSIARRSEELNQQTLVTINQFNENFRNLVWETDVYRLPSIKDLYQPYGWTALIDAAIRTDQDMDLIPQKYGKHLFLEYIVTDGFENRSANRPLTLQNRLNAMDANRTVAIMVPDAAGARSAQLYGFPKANVAVWDAESADGVKKVGETIYAATDSFMTRASQDGSFKGTKNLFSTGADTVNAASVQTLTPLTPGSFVVWDVAADSRIDEFVRANNGGKFNIGRGHYQLTKRETIQAGKDILILEVATGKLYGGFDAVRQLLNLPKGTDVRVTPDANPAYKVFVKSTAPNRKLLAGTQLVYLR